MLYIKKEEFDLIGFIKEKYKDVDKVRLVNPRQVYFYMQKGIYPLWNEVGYENKIVYVFEKEKTLRWFGEWRKYLSDMKSNN